MATAKKKAVIDYIEEQVASLTEKRVSYIMQLEGLAGLDIEKEMQELSDHIQEVQQEIKELIEENAAIVRQMAEYQQGDANCRVLLDRYESLISQYKADLQRLDFISKGEQAVKSMRNVMQRLLSVDKGVFVVSALNDSMISYSAGSKYFLTSGTGAPYERGGEFIGSIIRGYCPELASYIRDLLEQASDPITLLFEPVLEADMEVFSDQNQYEDIPAFKDINERTQWFLNGIKDGGTCLLNNLRNHPNPLTQLRLFNFFCVFSLMRYMTLLAEETVQYGQKKEQSVSEPPAAQDDTNNGVSRKEIEQLVKDFKRSCGDYHVSLKECNPEDTVVGPSVIRLKFRLGRGQSLQGLSSHLEDIGREMKRTGVIIQQVPNSDELLLEQNTR